MTARPLPLAVFESLQQVIDYLWDDELEDFQARKREDRQGHIFPELKRLRLWLEAQSRFGKGS